MDPAQCLEILSAHAASRQNGASVAYGCDVAGYPEQQGGEALINALLSQGNALDAVAESEQGSAEGPPAPPPPPLPPRGQVIDLVTGENELSAASIAKLFPALLDVPVRTAVDESRGQHPAETEAAMQSATGDGAAQSDEQALAQRIEQLQGAMPAYLVREVVQIHEQRVAVHKAYDAAFHHLLDSTGGGGEAIARTYPFVVGCATSRFASLSRGVRAAASLLEASANSESAPAPPATAEGAKEAAGLIRKVQRLEQDRLQLVAASHLEQTRLWAAGRGKAQDSDDDQTMQLARRSCADIKKKLGKASEEIEETISELRYCAADMED